MKKVLIIAGAVFVLLLIIGAASGNKSQDTDTEKNGAARSTTEPTTKVTEPTIQPTAMVASPAQKEYEVLSRKDAGDAENISLLVKAGTSGEAAAIAVKATCKKPCNIDVYDDKKAYDLNALYDEMMGKSTTQQSDLTNWKKTNYVYVGDHYIGGINFELGTYDEYPFRDWYYKELKGE